MHDIFISYSRRDTEVMLRVASVLRDAGLSVWTDEGIEPGTLSWKNALAKAILQCQVVVVLFSPDSSQSTWVHRELDYAELHRKRIYPLLVRGEISDAIPFGYTTYQFIDIRHEGQFDEGMTDLTASLSGHFSPSAMLKSEAQTSTPPTEYHDRTLWQWVDFNAIQLTVPAHWKVYDPSPGNIQKLQIMMMGNDETLFYRAIEDFNSNFIYQVTGSPLGKLESVCTMSNISGMSPLVGFLGEYRLPFPVPGVLMIPGMALFRGRISRFMRTRYRSELSDHQWKMSDTGRVYTHIWEFPSVIEGTQGMKGKVYTIFPTFARRSLFLSLICETSRFESERTTFDQIARSLHYRYA